MNKTEHYQLNKPEQDDFYNIDDMNENMDIIDKVLSSMPSLTSQLVNDCEYQTKDDIAAAVAEIVAGAPSDFDTLKELSDWIKNHEDSAAAMNASINNLKSRLSTVEWYTNFKGSTWSRVCKIKTRWTMGAFIFHVIISRSATQIVNTFLITIINRTARIIKIGASSNNRMGIRVVSQNGGISYVELFDNANNWTADNTTGATCTLTPLQTGDKVEYFKQFTDGSAVPDNHVVSATMITDSTSDIQASFSWNDIVNKPKYYRITWNNKILQKYTWGNNTDVSWRKLLSCTYTLGSSYGAVSVKGYLYTLDGDMREGEAREYPFVATMVMTSEATLTASAKLYISPSLKDDIIRIVKVSDTNYELQVRQYKKYTTCGVEYTTHLFGNNNTNITVYSPELTGVENVNVVQSVNDCSILTDHIMSYNDLVDKPEIDTELMAGSANAIQNKAVYSAIESLKKSVSDGKTLVAKAITDGGTTTAADAEFATMASNIGIMAEAKYWAGADDADNRPNTASINYKTGYNAGITYADGRANTASANYKAGYSAGAAAKKSFTLQLKPEQDSRGYWAVYAYVNGVRKDGWWVGETSNLPKMNTDIDTYYI